MRQVESSRARSLLALLPDAATRRALRLAVRIAPRCRGPERAAAAGTTIHLPQAGTALPGEAIFRNKSSNANRARSVAE